MSEYRQLLRPVLLIQTGILALSALEAAVMAVAGFGSPVPVLLTTAATVVVGASARTGKLSRPLCWTERIIVATFVIDTVIALFTAGATLEPMVWLSRLVVPVFVLRIARAGRTAGVDLSETAAPAVVPA